MTNSVYLISFPSLLLGRIQTCCISFPSSLWTSGGNSSGTVSVSRPWPSGSRVAQHFDWMFGCFCFRLPIDPGGPPSRLPCPTWETPSCCVLTEASCSPTSPWSTEMPSSESASFILSLNGWIEVFVLLRWQNFSGWNQFKYWSHIYHNSCVHPAWQQSSSLYTLHIFFFFFTNAIFICLEGQHLNMTSSGGQVYYSQHIDQK